MITAGLHCENMAMQIPNIDRMIELFLTTGVATDSYVFYRIYTISSNQPLQTTAAILGQCSISIVNKNIRKPEVK